LAKNRRGSGSPGGYCLGKVIRDKDGNTISRPRIFSGEPLASVGIAFERRAASLFCIIRVLDAVNELLKRAGLGYVVELEHLVPTCDRPGQLSIGIWKLKVVEEVR